MTGLVIGQRVLLGKASQATGLLTLLGVFVKLGDPFNISMHLPQAFSHTVIAPEALDRARRVTTAKDVVVTAALDDNLRV